MDKEAIRRARALRDIGVDSSQPMIRTKDCMEQFRQEFPDNDITLSTTTYFNGMPVAGMMDIRKGVLETGIASFDVETAKAVREEIKNAIGLSDMWEVEKQTVEYDTRHLEGRHVAGMKGSIKKSRPTRRPALPAGCIWSHTN